jgi:hypothetical protein
MTMKKEQALNEPVPPEPNEFPPAQVGFLAEQPDPPSPGAPLRLVPLPD